MNIESKTRDYLKSLFVTNATPSEADFAALIDSNINQGDDGIVKKAGDPLSIEAIGETGSVQKLLNFYKHLSDQAPAWSVNMTGAAGDRNIPGLNIATGSGTSQIFIDEATGNVGIGTTTPKSRLQANGDLTLGTDTNDQRFIFHSRGQSGGDFLQITPDDAQGQGRWGLGITLRRSGNVGIATVNPQKMLHVEGGELRVRASHNNSTPDIAAFYAQNLSQGIGISFNGINAIGSNADQDISIAAKGNGAVRISSGSVVVSRDIVFGTQTRQMLNLWSTEYAIGVQPNTQYYRTAKNFAWFNGGTHAEAEMNAGTNGTLSMVLSSGNLALGIAAPQKKLHVENGEVRVRSSHNNGTPDIAAFYANNLTQGIGIGYNNITALGGNADQDIYIVPRGNGSVVIGGYLKTAKTVFFQALLGDNSVVNAQAVVPLNQASVNVGGGFNTSTYKFTAPVSGVYLFTMSMLKVDDVATRQEWLHWFLMVNGNFANAGGTTTAEGSERCLLSSALNNTMSSRTIIVQLNVGDTVYVQQTGTGRCDNYRSGLTGALITAL